MAVTLAPRILAALLSAWFSHPVSLPHSNNHLANNSADQGAEGLGVSNFHASGDI